MRKRYAVTVIDVTEVKTVPDLWPTARWRAVLEALLEEATEDVSDVDLPEMVQMVLQDRSPSEAAERLLGVLLSDAMTAGQRHRLAEDWDDHPPWEHYTDMGLHLRLFEVGVALQAAFPKTYVKPRAVRVILEVAPADAAARALLDQPDPAFAARLLGPCAPNGIMYRLFDEALEGRRFPEAPALIWHLATAGERWTIHGSRHWLGAVEPGQFATVEAGPD